MATKRRKIPPRRRLGWVERTLEERVPPSDWYDFQQYQRWRQGRLAVPGLPDPQSVEGQALLRSMRVAPLMATCATCHAPFRAARTSGPGVRSSGRNLTFMVPGLHPPLPHIRSGGIGDFHTAKTLSSHRVQCFGRVGSRGLGMTGADGRIEPCPWLRPSADVRSAPLRSAPLRSAPLRSAPLRSAPLRLAPLRLAPLRLAPLRSAPLRSAPLRLAPLRLAPLRSAPLRSAPLRSAPLRSASLRSASLRSAR